ncbi:hypothetical protein [Roseovarius sp. EL26]|uniref:hypothetical protein n=1 Tax=Roseovarius sp. EL26 TaxID=2126672 RepID=UPI000EA24BDB|nr:hypothetical protein [Roseovarius sp. EL26]
MMDQSIQSWVVESEVAEKPSQDLKSGAPDASSWVWKMPHYEEAFGPKRLYDLGRTITKESCEGDFVHGEVRGDIIRGASFVIFFLASIVGFLVAVGFFVFVGFTFWQSVLVYFGAAPLVFVILLTYLYRPKLFR